MPGTIQTSRQITRIILDATDGLTQAAEGEQVRIFKDVLRWISAGGKYELDLDANGNLKPTGKNFATINRLAAELGKPASLNRIKKSAAVFGRATNDVSRANREYSKSEFGEAFKNAARYNLPGQKIRGRIAQNLRPEPYLAAFRDPIRGVVTSFTQNGMNFFDLVDQLRKDITGIVTTDPDGKRVQRGLLENYYQAKRITRDAMFGASRAEMSMIAEATGANWRRYIGGLVEDSRDECRRRVDLEYFTDKEVASWDKLKKSEWPEKIPGVPIAEQAGGYNCLHDIRAVSERRVPTSRVLESYRDGFLLKKETQAILERRGEVLTGSKPNPGSKPAKKPKKKEPVSRSPEASTTSKGTGKITGGRGEGELTIRKANLQKELNLNPKFSNLTKAGQDRLLQQNREEGLAEAFVNHSGSASDWSNYDLEGLNVVIGTMRSLKAQYGYASDYRTPVGRRWGLRLGEGPGTKNSPAWANAVSFGIRRDFVNGGYKETHKKTGEDYSKRWKSDREEMRRSMEIEKQRISHFASLSKNAESDTQAEFFQGLSDESADKYEVSKQRYENEIKRNRHNQFIVAGHPSFKGKTIEAVVIHEFGHVLHDQIFGGLNGERNRATREVIDKGEAQKLQREWTSAFRRHKKKDWVFEHLSEYGLANNKEFFAETFTLYNVRPDLIPDDIKDLFSSYWKILDDARETDSILK